METLSDRCADAERYVGEVARTLEERRRDAGARARELEAAQAGLAKAASAVRSQALSQADVEALGKRKGALRDGEARLGAERRAVEEECAALGRQVGSAVDSVSARSRESGRGRRFCDARRTSHSPCPHRPLLFPLAPSLCSCAPACQSTRPTPAACT